MADTVEYQCAVCGGEFESQVTVAQATKDLENDWPGTPVEECEVVCGNCYAKFMATVNTPEAS